MNKVYNKACDTNTTVSFVFGKNGRKFGGDPIDNFQTTSWPFGRLSSEVTGEMTCLEDGGYLVDGKVDFNSDTYSWKTDGDDPIHNAFILGMSDGTYNGPEKEDMVPNLSLMLIDMYSNNPRGITWSSWGVNGEHVEWGQASPSYDNPIDNNEMPIDYARDYEFSIAGNRK